MGYQARGRQSVGTLGRRVWVFAEWGWAWVGGVRRIGRACGREGEP